MTSINKKLKIALINSYKGIYMQPNTSITQINPIRVSQKTACQMLDLTPEGLRKLIIQDPTFPKKYKTGQSRQSAVWFDYAELVQWHNIQKQNYTV